MGKSLIYLVNSSSNTISAGNSIPLGAVTRKVGNAYYVGTNSVFINTPGYYSIDFAGTYTGTAGDVKIDIMQNGSALTSATETVGTASTEYHSVSIPAVVKVFCCAGATITVNVDSASTSTPTFSETVLRIIKE